MIVYKARKLKILVSVVQIYPRAPFKLFSIWNYLRHQLNGAVYDFIMGPYHRYYLAITPYLFSIIL